MHGERRDVIEEPPVFVVRDDQHGLGPTRRVRDHRRINRAQKCLPGRHRVGSVIVVGGRSKRRRVTIRRLEQHDFGKPAVRLGGEIGRELIEAPTVLPEHDTDLPQQQQEGQAAGMVHSPGDAAGVQPVEDERARDRWQHAPRRVHCSRAGEQHEAIRQRARGNGCEPAVAHAKTLGEETGDRNLVAAEEPHRLRMIGAVDRGELVVRIDEPAHRVAIGGLDMCQLARDGSSFVRHVGREFAVTHGKGIVRFPLEQILVLQDLERRPQPVDGVVQSLIAEMAEHVIERSVFEHDDHDRFQLRHQVAVGHGY